MVFPWDFLYFPFINRNEDIIIKYGLRYLLLPEEYSELAKKHLTKKLGCTIEEANAKWRGYFNDQRKISLQRQKVVFAFFLKDSCDNFTISEILPGKL